MLHRTWDQMYKLQALNVNLAVFQNSCTLCVSLYKIMVTLIQNHL